MLAVLRILPPAASRRSPLGYADSVGGPYAIWVSRSPCPGGCGAASYVLRGHGNPRTLAGAGHGAGRRVPRGAASRANGTELDAFVMHPLPLSALGRVASTALVRARCTWP